MNDNKNILDLSNFLVPYFDVSCHIKRGLAPGCLRGCCEGYHIVNNDGVTICYAEDLADFLNDTYIITNNIKCY